MLTSPDQSETLLERPDEAATLRLPGGTSAIQAAHPLTPTEHEAATVLFDEQVPACVSFDRLPTVLDPSNEATWRPGADSLVEPTAAGASAGAHPHHGAVRYVVERLAGEGGMGTVHVARDIDLLRRVALKELSSTAAHDRSARSRFVREVQVTAQLDHPHIVPVYSLEVAPDGRPAYAMKLVEGRTFAQLIADASAAHAAGREPGDDDGLPARIEAFLKVCDAIEYAHARGVVHRDLKPANLMLGRHNEVYVMDWGICRLVDQPAAEASPAAVHVNMASGATAFGAIVGTPLYMSPEQAQGRHADLDPRSDQCALGLILYELVTLQRPFAARTLADLLQQAAAGERRPVVHAYGAPVAPELAAIITRATAVDPARRYPDVGAFADDLRRYMRGEAVEARPESAWQQLLRRLARRRQAVALAILGFVIISLLTVVGLLWRHERAIEVHALREARTHAFVTEVTEQSDRLQTELHEVRTAVEALAAAAAHAVEFGTPSALPVPWVTGPVVDADFYFSTVPGVSRASVEATARRLLPLKGLERRVLATVREVLGGKSASPEDSGFHELRGALRSGLVLIRPAEALQHEEADMRTSAWYRAAMTGDGFHWASLQHDDDAERELALTAPIVATDGDRVGALGLVVSLDRVLVNLLQDERVHGAQATVLLDADGTVLATHAAASNAPGSGDGFARQLPLDRIWNRSDDHETGFIETSTPLGDVVLGYARIQPLGWTLISVISAEALFGSADAGN